MREAVIAAFMKSFDVRPGTKTTTEGRKNPDHLFSSQFKVEPLEILKGMKRRGGNNFDKPIPPIESGNLDSP